MGAAIKSEANSLKVNLRQIESKDLLDDSLSADCDSTQSVAGLD